ncbi:hypothetical protein D0Y65_044417 [Glycine soja]|uniref:Uncharacterized protein n=1 Tax=Glycine soja TaxID=3848 RepID=A0A445GLP8_GLYSO|nr:hypothetical protein D0Y65_044417 [Glycine soja]
MFSFGDFCDGVVCSQQILYVSVLPLFYKAHMYSVLVRKSDSGRRSHAEIRSSWVASKQWQIARHCSSQKPKGSQRTLFLKRASHIVVVACETQVLER